MEEQDLITLQGTVEAVTFRAESGFTVAELGYGNELITIVGDLVGIEEGEELSLTGRYTTHPKYGPQFKVLMFERRLPASPSHEHEGGRREGEGDYDLVQHGKRVAYDEGEEEVGDEEDHRTDD